MPSFDRTLDSAVACLARRLEVLKSESQAIFTVATAASTAADHVLSFSRTVEMEETDSGRDHSPAVAAQPLSTSDATPPIAAATADGATAA